MQLPLLAPARGDAAALAPGGAVYTKRWVVELLLDLAGYTSDKNLVDAVAVEPSAGEGAFVGPMAERLLASFRRQGRPLSDCRNSLVAFELNEASAVHARESLAEVAGWQLPLAWIRTGDYLFDSMQLEADYVIGNPPYIRLEEIPEETAQGYRDIYRTMRGRADLYVAFFEAALRQLKPDGVCAFICADHT